MEEVFLSSTHGRDNDAKDEEADRVSTRSRRTCKEARKDKEGKKDEKKDNEDEEADEEEEEFSDDSWDADEEFRKMFPKRKRLGEAFKPRALACWTSSRHQNSMCQEKTSTHQIQT